MHFFFICALVDYQSMMAAVYVSTFSISYLFFKQYRKCLPLYLLSSIERILLQFDWNSQHACFLTIIFRYWDPTEERLLPLCRDFWCSQSLGFNFTVSSLDLCFCRVLQNLIFVLMTFFDYMRFLCVSCFFYASVIYL